MGGRLKNTCMNQHDELGFKYLLGFTTELLNLRFYPLPSPLPRGEGMMVLKPTIIGFSAICPLSPWERAKPNNLKKTSSEKMATKNTHYPNHQKKNINNTCCQIRFRRPLPTKTDTHRLTKTYSRFAIRENDTDILGFRSLPNPLPQGEGIMVLKSTIIGLPAICPLSPWERARERAKPNNLKKTSSEKDGNKKYALPKPPKEKHKK